MSRILVATMLLVLGFNGMAFGYTKGCVIAGPMRYEKNYKHQDKTSFYIERVRVGEYAWFPSVLIIEGLTDEKEAQPFIGKNVLVFGEFTRIPITPPYLMEIDNISAIIARRILPVENRQDTVFTVAGVPDELSEKEGDLKFTVVNPLPYELDAARILIDLDGHFQFKGATSENYTTHHMQIDPVFKAHEKKEFLFPLIPSDLERESGHFAVSIMFWGYYVKGDVIEPVYAFWKKRW